MIIDFSKKFRVLAILMLLILLVSACAPVLTVTENDIAGKTAMNVIYDQTFGTLKGAWTQTAWIAAVALAIGLAALTYRLSGSGEGALTVGLIVGAVVLGVLMLIGNNSSVKGATHAVEVGADTGKTRKANQYVEKIHVPATSAKLETRDCYESDGGTGCRFFWTYDYNFHEVCTESTDSEGETTESCTIEHDTRYVPHFRQEWRFSANFAMLDKFLNSKVCLEYSGKDQNGDGKDDCVKLDDAHTGLTKSEIKNNPVKYYYDFRYELGGNSWLGGDNFAWQAPEDYQNYLWGPSNRDSFETSQVPDVPHQVPGEWKAIRAALDAGQPYIATFQHDYVNWVFASDAQNLMAQSSQIQKYLDLGILPRINMPYSRYGSNQTFALDYDFVQFLGGIQVANPQEWQNVAGFTTINAGPYLEGSMVVFFAPAGMIDNPDSWINAAKAYLSDRNTWGLTLAPKNLILVGCGVDTASNMIQFCRMETGMPSGNVEIKYTIDHLAPMPFTVQGVFGTPVATATLGADGIYENTVTVPSDGFMRLLFGRSPAQLVEMAGDEDVAWKIPWFQQVNVITDGFARVSMTSLDWLKTDMKLAAEDINWVLEAETKGGRSAATWTMVIAILIALGSLAVLFLNGDRY